MDKYDYTCHPEADKLVMCKASEHMPEWVKRPKPTEKETPEQPPKKEKKKVVPTGKDSVMSD